MEIDLNLEGLSKSKEEFPSDAQFAQKIDESREFRPLIMLHYTADIYRANTEQLSDLSPKLAGEIISFYQTMNFVKTLAEATGALAYVTISDESRKALPRRIRTELGSAIETGVKVSKELGEVLSRYD